MYKIIYYFTVAKSLKILNYAKNVPKWFPLLKVSQSFHFSCLYSDNVAQIGFQVSLSLCFIVTAIGLLSTSCTIIVSLYIFLYLSAFSFLLVESLIILHKLVDKIILEKLEKSVFVLASGSLPPLLFTLLTVPFLPPSLLSAPDQQSM